VPLRLLKLLLRAKELPEAVIVGRILLGLAGVFVLMPVASSLRDLGALSATDYIGLAVFVAVGIWLLQAAIRGPRPADEPAAHSGHNGRDQ
jgi:hypothetical protein